MTPGGGPAPSSPMSSDTVGRGFYSNYVTPESLVKSQRSEMHVVAVESGETNYFEYLKRIKSLEAGSTEDGGVEIAVELDVDAELNHPVVEVFVDPDDEGAVLVGSGTASAGTFAIPVLLPDPLPGNNLTVTVTSPTT